MVREFGRIAFVGNKSLNSLAILRRYRALQSVVVAIERFGQHRGCHVGLVDGVQWPAELGRHNLGPRDHKRGASGDIERGIVGRMDRAEQVRRRETWLVDPPEQAVGVEEIVGARRLG